MPDPATTSTTAAAGILAALTGSGGIAGLVTWARRITGRVAAVEVKVDHVLTAVQEERVSREKSDAELSTTLQRIADSDVEERRRLYEYIDNSAKEQTAVITKSADAANRLTTAVAVLDEKINNVRGKCKHCDDHK